MVLVPWPVKMIPAELQITEGIEDNSKIIFLISQMKTNVVTPHLNSLGETVLMMGQKICFYGDIWIVIPKLSLLPLLFWSTVPVRL